MGPLYWIASPRDDGIGKGHTRTWKKAKRSGQPLEIKIAENSELCLRGWNWTEGKRIIFPDQDGLRLLVSLVLKRQNQKFDPGTQIILRIQIRGAEVDSLSSVNVLNRSSKRVLR